MAESFRISSNDGKIPEISTKKEYDQVIEHVRSMEPSTAYVAVRGVLIPVLSKLKSEELSPPSTSSPMELARAQSQKIARSSISEAGKALNELTSRLGEMRRRLNDLDVSKGSIVERWKDSFEKSPISSSNENFRNFYYLRENLIKDLDQIKRLIQKLRTTLPQTSSVKATLSSLETIRKALLSKIPKPSSHWTGSTGHWKPPGHTGESLRFWWQKKEGEPADIVFWKDKDSKLPENPIGLLEMVLQPDQKEYKDYIAFIEKGLKQTTELLSPYKRGKLFEPLTKLDTESAYMYLVSTLLPALQNESAEAIEKTGDLMKQISKIFDKYNQLQEEITYVQKIAKKFMEERGSFFTGDDWKDFEKFRDLRTNINLLVSQIRSFLDGVTKQLPPSAQSLVTTLEEINDRLLDMPEPSDKWNPTTSEYEGKSWIGKDGSGNDVTIKWLEKENPLGLIERMLDPDQTDFKSYMDNVAQAITAMTSISNMTQQEVQIASQYHNSLLGLQKNAYDSINKIIQIATKPPSS